MLLHVPTAVWHWPILQMRHLSSLDLPSCISSDSKDTQILFLPFRYPLPSQKSNINILITIERKKCDERNYVAKYIY